jgi:hypothetical protein
MWFIVNVIVWLFYSCVHVCYSDGVLLSFCFHWFGWWFISDDALMLWCSAPFLCIMKLDAHVCYSALELFACTKKNLCCVRLLCSEIICLHKKLRWVGLLCSRIVCLQKKKCWVGTIIYVVRRSQHPLHLTLIHTGFYYFYIMCLVARIWRANEEQDSSYELTMARPVFGLLYLVILTRTHRCNLDVFVCIHRYVEIGRT